MSDRYVELALQTAAIRWLTEHWGYSEALSGEPSNNDRFDSVGAMDGRAVLIEVKPKIHGGMAHHSAQRPGSIESKISGVLKDLHDGRRNPLSLAARKCWDRSRPPVIAILAGEYSGAGSAELTRMLERRSPEWLFDFRVWRWTGSEIEELARGDLKPPPGIARYDALKIEKLTASAQCNKKLSMDELGDVARQRGVGGLFEHARRLASELGYRAKPGRTSVTLSQRWRDGTWKSVSGLSR